jgi:hypothetical protein
MTRAAEGLVGKALDVNRAFVVQDVERRLMLVVCEVADRHKVAATMQSLGVDFAVVWRKKRCH